MAGSRVDGAGMFFQKKKVRVVIIDDERLSADVLRLALAGAREIEVAGMAHDAAAGIALCRALRPEVVLIDWILREGDGLEVLNTLRGELPATRWCLVSAFGYADMVFAAEAAGAHGVIDKAAADVAMIREAVRVITAGKEFFCPVSSQYLRRALPLVHPPLTEREKKILKQLARYESRKTIAAEAGLAPSTITEHIARIARKLGLDERAGASVIVPAARKAGALPKLPSADGLE